MREFVKFIAALSITLIMMLMFRALFFTIYRVPDTSLEPQLKNGDRILVNRCSYGLRTGEDTRFGYSRWLGNPVSKGDIAAFNYPASTNTTVSASPVLLGCCTAVPGDTVLAEDGFAIILPGKDDVVRVTPQNAVFVCNMLRKHEHRSAYVCSDILYIDGRETHEVKFEKDYYWMSSLSPHNTFDSRYFGLVPEDCIIGRAIMLVYSISPDRKLYECLRRNRFLKLL